MLLTWAPLSIPGGAAEMTAVTGNSGKAVAFGHAGTGRVVVLVQSTSGR